MVDIIASNEMAFFVVLFLLSISIFKYRIKGYIGELLVRFIIIKLNYDNYCVLNNIYLPKGEGTSQLDHVIICDIGIIVIETKNYQGWIYGSENSKNWTQVIYTKKNKFLNPIIQNKGHIKALKENINLEFNIEYHSIITFAGSGKIKTINEISTPITYLYNLKKEIQNLNSSSKLTKNQIDEILRVLSQKIITEKGIRRKHVQYLRNSKNVVDINITQTANMDTCPRCGSTLVVRNGRNGKFLGCSSFPKCKYTQNIKETT